MATPRSPSRTARRFSRFSSICGMPTRTYGESPFPDMALALLKSLFDGNEREVSRLRKTAVAVNALEPAISALDNEALAAKTQEFKSRLAEGAELDEMLPEVFAVCREAGKRILGMLHFDVQIMGGQTLHE